MSDLEQVARETRSSIELTRNAKADYQYSIKRYFDHDEPGGAERALADVERAEAWLRETYIASATSADVRSDLADELSDSIDALHNARALAGRGSDGAE